MSEPIELRTRLLGCREGDYSVSLATQIPKRKTHNIRPLTDDERAIRKRAGATETFRTPLHAYTSLLEYEPSWFLGSGFDPSAGDGRMLAEVTRMFGNTGPHYLNDIREEERLSMQMVGMARVGDYLEWDSPPACDFMLTNPPFTKAVEFVEKGRTHISGPIMILQRLGWIGTQKRSHWMAASDLAHVLILPKRPRWEVDVGDATNNTDEFAWFIFMPGHQARPYVDWLF